MNDIPEFSDFTKVEPINKGWSDDKKYCVTTTDGVKYLLRISPIERYDMRKALFAMMKRVVALGTPMCEPIDFGTCDDGVYSLLNNKIYDFKMRDKAIRAFESSVLEAGF